MQSKSSKHRKGETTQEAFRKLRERDRAAMHEKMQKIEDAQDRARAAIAKKERKRDRGRKKDNPQPNVADTKKGRRMIDSSGVSSIRAIEPCPRSPIPMTTKLGKVIKSCDVPKCPLAQKAFNLAMIKSKQQRRKKRGRCANCCGGLPGQGPADGCGVHCCCSSGIRLRGGSDTGRWMDENPPRSFRVRSLSENPRVLQTPRDHCSGHSSRMTIFEDRKDTRFNCGQDAQFCDIPREGERIRGGCGSCGAQRSASRNQPATSRNPTCLKQMEFPCDRPSQPDKPTNSQQNGGGGCPCGGCGGSACADNPGGGGRDGGCCGGNRPQGKPCKCKCQSCDSFRPLGGCGGQSCGKMYSCAGSGGGRCCFPRNTKRRSGPDCCGGGDPSCGGCC